MSPVTSIAAASLVGAFGRFDDAASRTVQAANGDGGDLTREVIGLDQASYGYRYAYQYGATHSA